MSHSLNPAQREAVETLSGPLLVLAGAGTGKTRVVTYRIARLIATGIAPNRILAVTFTNKAAKEMQERIRGLLGKRISKDCQPSISTFHSHCVKVLRRHIRELGYPERFAIYTRGDQESIARTVLREIHVPDTTLRPGDLLNMIGNWKTHGVTPAKAASRAETDKEHLAASGYRRYQRALKNAGAVDFDDLLLCTEELFRKHEPIRLEEAGQFDHLLVDEYQDTNGTQYRIIESLARDHRNLCVVGDDDQSIYGWRGAEVQHILRFNRDWPEAKVVRLEDNYRSTDAILSMANRLIAFNRHRHDKVLRAARPGGERPRIEQYKDEEQEAQGVARAIQRQLQQPGVEPRDFAILFRTNEQPRPFETELRKAKIPYILIGGKSFFDRKEVKDILSYLRVIHTPEDETSLKRIINTPPRGIGAKSIESLTRVAVERGTFMWNVLYQAGTISGVTRSAAEAIAKFRGLVQSLQKQAEGGDLVQVTRDLIAKIRYHDELQRIYNDPADVETRWNSVEELVNAVGAYQLKAKRPNLGDFLDEIALGDRDDDRDKEKELQRNGVALMTLHSAKGLEFPNVFLVGMEEGILPHKRSVESGDDAMIDEERRLCYVGITRAQERLALSLTLTRMKWGKARDTIPSRFLFEAIGQADQSRHAERTDESEQPGSLRKKRPTRTRR
ncbi:MAG: UvrD-helicase domain-containing protein [Planctomycetales bacterium]|nr:UvrD-helicase domain-containing protein [Planctomycetales bacterium]